MAITRGDTVEVTTASGRALTMRAMGGPGPGHDFTVVWVCTEDEWLRAEAAQEEPDGLPWPVESVKELTTA